MLLIDGVRYEVWTPGTEDEFEWVMKAHTEDIFGEESIYFDLKKKLITKAGIGSIPDGYVITLGNTPEVQIIELELASHTLQHIVSQIVNITNGIENPTTQQKICNAIEDGINQDEIFATKIAKAIKPVAIHRFLSDCFSNIPPIINIIIDKSSPALEEAINKIAYPHRIIEFQTFTREGVGLAVHAHLFEPLYEGEKRDSRGDKNQEENGKDGKGGKKEGAKRPRVTFAELVERGLLQDGQVLYFYKTKLFSDEIAQVIASENMLRYQADGNPYSKTGLAKRLSRKYGFKDVELRGPEYWKTEDGRLLVELEEQVRIQRGDRK